MCVRLCVCIHQPGATVPNVCAPRHLFLPTATNDDVYVCVCACLCVQVCVCLCLLWGVCVFMFVFKWVCVCVCTCACVHMLHPRLCKARLVGQSTGLSLFRGRWFDSGKVFKNWELKSTFEHIELRAKLLNYCFRSNKSNIHQSLPCCETVPAACSLCRCFYTRKIDEVCVRVCACVRVCVFVLPCCMFHTPFTAHNSQKLYMCMCMCVRVRLRVRFFRSVCCFDLNQTMRYGVATIRRLLKFRGLCCRRAL